MTAETSLLYLVRQDPTSESGAVICRFDLVELLTRPDTMARPGDTLLVNPTSLATWDRTWTQILPVASQSSFIYRNVDQTQD